MTKIERKTSIYICYKCVGDEYVSHRINELGNPYKCTFCNKTRSAITIDAFADLVNNALLLNFRIAEEHPVFESNSDRINWELGGDLIQYTLADTLLIDEPVVLSLVRNLKKLADDGEIEPAFDYSDNEMHIEPFLHESSDSQYYSTPWQEFANEAKHRGRYFNKAVLYQLQQMLAGVKSFRSSKGNIAIQIINPGDANSVFFRARQANDDSLRLRICLNPSKELGPPPPKLATPGRMNPAGVSVFYGSFEINTCISEIRLPVGGIVATSCFKLIKPIRVLDLTVFDEGPEHISYFDRDRYEKISQMVWLEAFHKEISKPVLPQDELFDYVPTQIVSEYLATKFSPQLDGIIYSSALTSEGRNIVLFNHAASVKLGSIRKSRAKNKELVGFLENFTYWVEEKSSKESTSEQLLDFVSFVEPSVEPTLEYVPRSLELHQVKSINLSTRPIVIINRTELKNFNRNRKKLPKLVKPFLQTRKDD